METTIHKAHYNCAACSRKLAKHKIYIKCVNCSHYYHPKCVELTPSDVKHIYAINGHNNWSCIHCNTMIFPFSGSSEFYDDKSAKKLESRNKISQKISQEICKTCHKPGTNSNMISCELCGHKSHSHTRCSAGKLGCKDCLRDIFPGYVADPSALYNFKNTAVFNPYSCHSDINFIGNANDESDYGHLAWSNFSNLLDTCDYYEFNDIKPSRNYELKVLSLNIRSLKDKIGKIRENIANYSKFDVLCFNETNCNPQNMPFNGNELFLDNFHKPFLQSPARLSNRGGGLAIYVNKSLTSETNCKILPEMSYNADPMKGEFMFLEIKTKYKKIIICNMYRSPSGDISSFMSELDMRLQSLKSHKNKVILFVSDSNIDLLNYGHFEPATKLVNNFSEYGFAPTISRPTRVTCYTATLIDHIFSNDCTAITKSGVITESLSDHLAVFINLILDPQKINCKLANCEITSYLHQNLSDEENLKKFNHDIAHTNWDSITATASADEKFNLFESKYKEIYDKNFPKTTKKSKKRKCDKPWILPWLQCACDRKNKLYNIYIKNPSVENKSKYFKMKRFVAKHVRLAKKRFYKNYFSRYSNDGRKQWDMINQLLNRKRKGNNTIKKLLYNDQIVTNPQHIADSFNEFFCNIAQKLKDENSSTPGSGCRPPEPTICNSRRNFISMTAEDCTKHEIENIINSLNNKATSDVSMQPLKYVCNTIAPILSHIISASLEQGIFPTKLKCAKVIPLHKGGPSTEITNYRPISLLSCFSKIYEKVMHSRLVKFLDENNLIYKSQYGFRSGHSCEHALLEVQHKLNKALERKQIAVLLLIDFSKAFDMVDHDILLGKLEHCGIRGRYLDWFKSYLTNRHQYVHVNNCNSKSLPLRYSVPQGSILGPILFILYANDLPEVSRLADFVLFADDANLIITGYTYDELQEKVNTVLMLVQNWVIRNGLKLNIKKTKYMIFTNKIKQKLEISLNGVDIEHSEHERFLGVIVDSGLTWSYHINLLAAKVSRNAGILYKLKGIVPNATLKMLYNSFVHSHLNYCSSVWGLGSKNSLSKLFISQKKAIRAIGNKFNSYFYNKDTDTPPCHTKSIFNANDILTVYNLITKNCLAAMHKTYLNVSPLGILYLFNIINLNRPRRDPKYFEVPYSRLKSSDKLIAYKGPKIYNYIANEINKSILRDEQPVQNKFMNSFKATITRYLLKIQKLGDENWTEDNFVTVN